MLDPVRAEDNDSNSKSSQKTKKGQLFERNNPNQDWQSSGQHQQLSNSTKVCQSKPKLN
jgi:hypothetical protein